MMMACHRTTSPSLMHALRVATHAHTLVVVVAVVGVGHPLVYEAQTRMPLFVRLPRECTDACPDLRAWLVVADDRV
jgi:hypothetical protein